MMNSVKRHGVLLAAACMAALSVAACGQSGKDGRTDKTEAAAAPTGSESAAEKFNAYTEGFNALIDDSWGVAENFSRYQELDIPNANASGNLNFPENASNLERALEKLTAGRVVKAGAEAREADAATDKVIATGQVLLAQWKELDPYFESRAYREDGLAKAKTAHPALMAAYQNNLAAIDELDAALSKYLRQRAEQRIAALRKGGHNEEADLSEAMQLADFFSTAVIENNVAEADRLMPQLEAALTKVRQAESTLPTDHSNKAEFSLISGYLTSMVGDWRDFKQSSNDSERESIVDNYNRAVDQMSDVEFSL